MSLLAAYHALPWPARAAVANVRGAYLRRWRYGADADALADAALERESWSGAQWDRWREERLAFVLRRAAERVPYYRRAWEERRRAGNAGAPERLQDWPILPKDAVRRDPRAFVADDCNPSRMFREHTSGTTGQPLELWWSRATVRAWYALFEARVRRWNGVSRNDPWAMLGGQLVAPARRTRPPFWVWNSPLRQLYMSSYHLAPSTVGAYAEAMRRHGVAYVFGYASSLFSFARMIREGGHRAPALRVAISNAEPLLDAQREEISAVLGCPVRDTYGAAEIVANASECAAGRLHAWPESGLLEILDEAGNPAPAGEKGRLVATGLLNADMPLVRYETGDRAALAPAQTNCACGRRLPVMEGVDGRDDDVLVTPDGRRIGRLDPVFKGGLPIREAQIVQERLDRVVARVVPAEGFGDRHAAEIERRLADRLGPSVEVAVELTDRIARTSAGKFRATISRVPPEQRRAPVSKSGGQGTGEATPLAVRGD